MLEAGWTAAGCAFGPARAAHLRRHVVARRGRVNMDWQHGRLIGHDAMAPHGGLSRAGRGVGAFATRARCVGGGVGRSPPSVAFMRCWGAGRIVRWSVLVFGAKWFPGFAAVNYLRDATCRAAGSSGHARGSAGLPFMVGPRGEVVVRGATGPPPAHTSGADGRPYIRLWDDGGAARGPPRGPAAALPSDPGPRG